MTQRLFCFGMGYTATALARGLIGEGWEVLGTTRNADRSEEKVNALTALGIQALRFDGASPSPEIDRALSSCDHVLVSVPPDQQGCPVHRCHQGQTNGKAWVGYLSSTGVYGDHGGAWVSETSPTTPTSDLGENRLAAERQWRSIQPPAHVFRLAAIYGPGRSVLDRIRARRGARIEHPALISRVHVYDIVQAIRATITTPCPGEIFNVADTEPTTNLAFTDMAYDLLGMDRPPAIGLDHPMIPELTRKHFADSKRVDASKMRDMLGVKLRYPTGVEGLRQCLERLSESGV